MRYYSDETPDHWWRVLYVDPAIGQRESSDYFVAVAMAASPIGEKLELRVIDYFKGKLSAGEQVRRIAEMARRSNVDECGVEAVAYQASLQQLVDEECRRTGVYTHVVPIFNAKAKTLRIRKISPIVEFGDLLFDSEKHAELIEHMCDWPAVSHDDDEDAVAGAVEMIRQTGRLDVE